MKIGQFVFKDYAVMKPLALSSSGKMLSVSDVASGTGLPTGSLHAIPEEMQIHLALERYRREPEFRIGIFNTGILSKAEVIRHITDRTPFGRLAVQVEMQYCNELISALRSNTIAHFPAREPIPFPEMPEWRHTGDAAWFRVKGIALFAENTTDPVTVSFAAYRLTHVHPVFEARGFRVVANVDAEDTRQNFARTARKQLTVYESGIGHGSYDVFTGHAGEPILEVGGYDQSEVAGKAIHFLSCQTGALLGRDAVEKGASCYAGFDENFTFVWDDPDTPVNEVDLFKKSDSAFDIHMANGFTAGEAYDASIATYNASIALVPGTVTASWLSYNRDHLRLHGDRNARIVPFKYARINLPLKKIAEEEMLADIGELID